MGSFKPETFLRSIRTFAYSVLLACLLIAAHNLTSNAQTDNGSRSLYVAVTGNDVTGDGSLHNPLLTIQRAIDLAKNGDEVVVSPGTYSGLGNSNLNFGGKMIKVRSEEPSNPEFIRDTIIDPQGSGVVARFLLDEGPESVLEGFTLKAGDTEASVFRGVVGFFAFSQDASPTIKSVRVEKDQSETITEPRSLNFSAVAPFNMQRKWDGLNPFHQPVATLDYYGSGDANNDGLVNNDDVTFAQDIVRGIQPINLRADVDGNGIVNYADTELINAAVSGANLPSWWNQTDSREKRVSWVKKIIALDPTEQHPYQYPGYVCWHFARQFHIKNAGYRNELYYTLFDGGEAAYNLPMYHVNVYAYNFAHAINAILVGEDPLEFDDWLFIEPQNDEIVHVGSWDMPYGSRVIIDSGEFLGDWRSEDKRIVWEVDINSQVIVDYDPRLLLDRPTSQPITQKQTKDKWHHEAFSTGSEHLIIFESVTDDLSRNMGLHLSLFPIDEEENRVHVVTPGTHSWLLDIAEDQHNHLHLLWVSYVDYLPSVFYGILDMSDYSLREVSRLSGGSNSKITVGRLLFDSNENIHAFWLDEVNNNAGDAIPGIYWSQRVGSGWTKEERITSNMPKDPYVLWITHFDGMYPLDRRYLFDVAISSEDEIHLVWIAPRNGSRDVYIMRETIFDGMWKPPVIVEDRAVGGVTLAYDASDSLHMAYWIPNPDFSTGEFGILYHRIHDGSSWKAPQFVDEGAAYPKLAAREDSSPVMVWSKLDSQHTRVFPVWSVYMTNGWIPSKELQVDANSEGWYPQVKWFSDRSLVFTWSSRATELVTVESEILDAPQFSATFLPMLLR